MLIQVQNVIHRKDCAKAKGKPYMLLDIKEILDLQGLKLCKCCKEQYKEMVYTYNIKQKYEEYVGFLKQSALEYGFTLTIRDNDDVEIATNIEKWIIHIVQFCGEGTAKIVLYHKNNLLFKHSVKCGSSIYPEYHIQFKDTLLPTDIVTYVAKHEQGKWGVSTAKTERI